MRDAGCRQCRGNLALAVWVVGLFSIVEDFVIGLAPGSLVALVGGWNLVESIVAAVAGAWVYKEGA